MANDLTKTLKVFFDKTTEGMDATVVLAQQASQYTPPAMDMSRTDNTFWRPQPTMLKMNSGWDTTGQNPQDLIKLSVPEYINQKGNIEIALNLQEMQDPTNMQAAVDAAKLQIAATVDMATADSVSKSGTIVVTDTAAMNWKLGARADALMNALGVKMGSERSLFLNPDDYLAIADQLGQKQFHQGSVKSAWEDARIPNVASFTSFQTDYAGYLNGNTVTTVTLAADATYTPTAMKADPNTGGELPVDNRSATLSVNTGASVKVGDAFTIANVYAVHHVKKTKLPHLKTFRVLAVSGNTVTYSPPVIPTGPYQNVDSKGVSGAALRFLNSVSAAPSIFWRKNSIEIVKGSFDGLQPMGGAQLMKTTTPKLGLPIAMLYWLDGKSVTYNVKFLVSFGVNNLNPEMNGIILANQAQISQVTATRNLGGFVQQPQEQPQPPVDDQTPPAGDQTQPPAGEQTPPPADETKKK